MNSAKNAHEVMQDLEESSKPSCDCKHENNCVAYESYGVIKCTKQDTYFYLQNFLEGILSKHSLGMRGLS